MDVLKKLVELESKATAAPWRSGQEFVHVLGMLAVTIESGPDGDESVCPAVAFGDDDETFANARMLAALRNAAPAMLKVCEAAKKHRYHAKHAIGEQMNPGTPLVHTNAASHWADVLDGALAALDSPSTH